MDTSGTEMDATTFLHLTSLLWLLAQSLPLILWPSFIITLLASANYYPSPHTTKSRSTSSFFTIPKYIPRPPKSPPHAILRSIWKQSANTKTTLVETYFARSLGLSQLFFALVLLVLSGLLPLGPAGTTSANNPYAQAVVLITTLYHAAAGIYSYTRFTATGGQVAYLIGSLGSGFLSCVGLYVLLFGDEKRLSRRTGADKSTSGWPFRNAVADKRKKTRRS